MISEGFLREGEEFFLFVYLMQGTPPSPPQDLLRTIDGPGYIELSVFCFVWQAPIACFLCLPTPDRE